MYSSKFTIVKTTTDEEPFIWDFKDSKWRDLKFKVKETLKSIYYWFKRLFNRKYALDQDCVWLNTTLAKFILPRLIHYRNMNNAAFPAYFSNHGGMKAWNKAVDEMIFAFDYFLHELEDEFWVKYYNETPYEEKEENKCISYHFYSLEERPGLSRWMSSQEKDGHEGYELRRIEESYFNKEMLKAAEKRAQNGLKLFSKHFTGL